MVEGKDFDFATPIAHYFMVDLMLGYITDPMMFPYSEEVCQTIGIDLLSIGFMESRGLAKSTIVISFFGVYSAIKGELPNGIGKVYFYLWLAASSKGGARINALAVRSMCEESKFLNEYFEEMRFTETESEFVRKCPSGKTGKQAKVPRKHRSFLVRYQGINTGVRGSRYGERRPCLIGLDDAILNTAAAYSKVMMANLENILYSDALAALKGGGRGRIFITFTPFHYNDVNTKAILNGTFTPCVIPIAKWFDVDKEGLTARDIKSSWDDMHPTTSRASMVKKAKAANKMKMFMQERMLRLTSGSDRLVPDKCMQWCDTRMIMDHIYAYNIYITTDYTTTSGENSDTSGCAVWAISNNGDWFMLELALRKMDMDEQYRITMDWAAKYKRLGKHVEIGVEVDGNQGAHIFALEKIMMERSDWYTFARQKNVDRDETRKGILSRRAGGSKHDRFRIAVSNIVLPMKLWLPEHLKSTPDMKEFVEQIKGATHENFTRADDGPDLVSMLNHMVTVQPTEAPRENKTSKSSRSVWSNMDWDDDKDEDNYGSSTVF
jgi:phage terminase large subunit-like protein